MRISYLSDDFRIRISRVYTFFLIGMISGSYASRYFVFPIFRNYHILLYKIRNSFQARLLLSILPISISFIIRLNKSDILLPYVAFLKGYLFSYISVLLFLSNRGWINNLIFLFSDSAQIPVLLHYWTEEKESNPEIIRSFFLHLSVCIFVTVFDNFVFSPLIQSIAEIKIGLPIT